MATAGSSTGAGAGSQRKRPDVLFRGDSRPPQVIFKEGFQPKGGSGGNTDVKTHGKGGDALKKTGFVSTSASRRIPPIFMDFVEKKGKLDTMKAKDGHEYVKREGWIYTIKPAEDMKMVYVPDELTDPVMKGSLKYQQEWAVEGGIPGKNVKEAQKFKGYVRPDDSLDGRGPFMLSPADPPSLLKRFLLLLGAETPDPFDKNTIPNPYI